MDHVKIRCAAEADLPALVQIYNHYVAATHITFDIAPFTTDERRSWFAQFSESGPHRLLVADASRIAGYASSSPFRPKPAYSCSVETTIYLAPEFTGHGLGRILYRTLLESLEEESSVHRAYGGIALPNPQSIALHQSLGFNLVGTFREVGFKLGKFWDVSWYERDLSANICRSTRRCS